jgi:hypothetical protein
VILVARNQEKGMIVAIRVYATRGDLSSIVNGRHPLHLNSGIGGKKRVQVNHRTAILPQECKRAIGPRNTDNLS